MSAACAQGTPTTEQTPPVRYPVLRPNGRFQFDAAAYEDDQKHLSSGTEVRRARLAVAGFMTANWSFQLELEYADDLARVSDAWVQYAFSPSMRAQVGHFKEFFDLEGTTSSRFLTFMERSIVDGILPARHMGAALRTAFKPTTFALGVFGQSPGDIGDQNLESREAFGLLGRATVAPIVSPTRVLHFGASARYRTPDARTGGADVVRFRSFSETHVDRTRFLDTGNLTGVSSYDQFEVETAGVYGPLSVQAENVWTSVARTTLEDPSFGGGYAFVTWLVTGESRVYDPLNGVFLQPVPRRKLGAVELGLRYSTLDLNDFDVTGGLGHNWTIGVNWYANVNVRFTANYVITNHDILADANGTEAGDDDFRALLLRMAFWF